ncbi:MAG: AEC family transporter [Anaerolineae bacterium]|nr:AEC family transporter [Anaerolineae bacterium]MCB0200212.1 AEC family transporter [Anaerolineae bacterium]MCB0205330.1 AEC family transporter [Anaerolineae bacterium]MCB0255022.1 AEC family transporter [Anaerolineae bacterium]
MRAALEVLWQVLAPIFLTAGAGFLLARKLGVKPQGLSRAAFYIFTPCLLFDKFSTTALSPTELGRIALFAVLVIAGSGLVAWAVSAVAGYGRPATMALILCVIAGNTGNYGLPANQFAFGEKALEPAVIYFAISTLILSTVGVYLVARGQRQARAALRNVVTVPLVYAGLAGLLVWALHIKVPVPIERATSLAGQAAVPVMLTLLGIQLAGVRLRSDIGRIGLASAIKLVVSPLLGVLFAQFLGLGGIVRQAAILESAMPTAVMATVLTTEYEAAPEFTAGTVLVSTLASFVTVSFVLAFLR